MRRTLSIVAGLGLGAVLSQFPEYAQQYAQRLGGAIDELSAIVAEFDAGASRAGLTRPEALARYARTGDTFIADRGIDMGATIARFEHLALLQAEVRSAGPVERALYFPEFFDPQIAARTLDDFQPALPLTVEGLAYAGVGLVVGGGVVFFVYGWLRELLRRPRITLRDDPGY